MRALIYLWCLAAAIVLAVAMAIHFSTFGPVDPMDEWPGVMKFHLVVFGHSVAAILFATWSRAVRRDPGRAFTAAPWPLKVLCGVLFAYAFVNFVAFMILNEGGGPHERDGKYVLSGHGRVIREVTEAEFHRHRAYEVRGVSGHWMFFSAVALTLLVGAARWGPGAGWEAEAEPTGVPADGGSFYLGE